MSIKRGMILSAGMGTRLSPVTDKMPKPLVPVLNLPNIVYAIHLLNQSGIASIVVNLHYLADSIRNYLKDGSQFGVKIQYTYEPTLLGTGGGVKNAETLFGNEPFVLVNCDFISNINLRPVIEAHLHSQAVATMVLTPSQGKDYTPVYFDENCRLVGIGKSSLPNAFSATFTGIHVLSPSALKYLRPVHSGINQDLYPRLISEKPDAARCVLDNKSHWFDTGDIRTLYTTSCDLLKELNEPASAVHRSALESHLKYFETKPNVWIPIGKTLPTTVQFQGPCIIGSPENLTKGCHVGPNVVLSSETFVQAPIHISNLVSLGENLFKGEVGAGLFHNSRQLI